MIFLPEVESGNDEPLYNIGVVSRMTGISMATLRAWERRYEFPTAKRTSGGHRLYSEKDVMRLRWVKERIDQGIQTAQSIGALRHQEQAGELVHSSQELNNEKSIPDQTLSNEGKPFIQVFQDRLFEGLIRRDIQHADEVLGEALTVATPEDLIMGIITPVLTRIGDGWENGEISVGLEHFGTNYLRQRLLMWMLNGPPPIKAAPIVLSCAPGEWHEGSLLIMGALLRRRRWPVAYLGQSVPLQDLANFVQDISPSLIIMVAMVEETAANLLDWPAWMPEIAHGGKPTVGFGGRIYVDQPAWRARMPGIYLGSNFEEGIISAEKILRQ